MEECSISQPSGIKDAVWNEFVRKFKPKCYAAGFGEAFIAIDEKEKPDIFAAGDIHEKSESRQDQSPISVISESLETIKSRHYQAFLSERVELDRTKCSAAQLAACDEKDRQFPHLKNNKSKQEFLDFFAKARKIFGANFFPLKLTCQKYIDADLAGMNQHLKKGMEKTGKRKLFVHSGALQNDIVPHQVLGLFYGDYSFGDDYIRAGERYVEFDLYRLDLASPETLAKFEVADVFNSLGLWDKITPQKGRGMVVLNPDYNPHRYIGLYR